MFVYAFNGCNEKPKQLLHTLSDNMPHGTRIPSSPPSLPGSPAIHMYEHAHAHTHVHLPLAVSLMLTSFGGLFHKKKNKQKTFCFVVCRLLAVFGF